MDFKVGDHVEYLGGSSWEKAEPTILKGNLIVTAVHEYAIRVGHLLHRKHHFRIISKEKLFTKLYLTLKS